MRDKTKKKGIRERKIEADIMEKKLEMDGIIKYQFRHKPVPPEVIIPRYNTIKEADEARRNAIRSQSLINTKKNEAPFSFWEKEKMKQKMTMDPDLMLPHEMQREPFKANPIPRACSVLIFDKKTHEDELKRGERIRKNAEIAYAKAKMPPTMQKYADRKKQEPVKNLQE